MIKRIMKIGFLLCGGLISFSLSAQSIEVRAKPVIEIITSDALPVSGIQAARQQGYSIQVYNLDEGKRLVKRLAGKLPPNEKAAKKQLENNLKRMGPNAVQTAFIQAFKAQQVAAQYGLDRYPAIVFDQGQAVVYGITDIGSALQHYTAWKER